MAKVKVSRFLGYSSKPDDLIAGNPSIAEDCSNVIINKGDLVNHPYILARFDWTIPESAVEFGSRKSTGQRKEDDDNKQQVSGVRGPIVFQGEKLLTFYYFQQIPYMLNYRADGNFYFSRFAIFDNPPSSNFLRLGPAGVSPGLRDFWPIAFDPIFGRRTTLPQLEPPEDNRAITGNLLQIGEWIYFFSQFYEVQSAPANLPRMVRFKRTNLNRYTSGLVGIRAPAGTADSVDTATAGSIPEGDYNFAFTLTTNLKSYTSSDSSTGHVTKLDPDDIESTAVEFAGDDVTLDGTEAATISIYLPSNHTFWEPPTNPNFGDIGFTQGLIGVYVKKTDDDDQFYYLAGYYPWINVLTEIDTSSEFLGYRKLTVTIDFTTRNKTVIAPLANHVVAHGVPLPARHLEWYKGRLYSLPIESDLGQWPLNIIQYSPLDIDEGKIAQDQGHTGNDSLRASKRVANYIDSDSPEFIGDNNQPLTGLIEWRGQLIIFQPRKTWVLTDDIKKGEVRELFNNLGCVNRNGGKGYIVINDILYFVSLHGIYRFDGQNEPQHISEEIEEDLEKIDPKRYTYVRLSSDPRYELLYVNFPVGFTGNSEIPGKVDFVPSFIYHYGKDEGGIWTKTNSSLQISDVVVEEPTFSSDLRVYYNTQKYLLKSGRLKDADSFDGRDWNWLSSLIDGGDSSIRKYWRELKILTLDDIDDVKFHGITLNNKKNILGVFILDSTKFTHLGAHQEVIQIQLFGATISFQGSAYSPTHYKRNPFRINGFIIDASITGRR